MLAAALSLALTVTVLIALPGPSILFIVGQALAAGRRAAFLSVVGNAAGTLTAGVAVCLLLGPLLGTADWLQKVLSIAGACVLFLLAFSYARQARATVNASHGPEVAQSSESSRSSGPLLHGWAVGVTNPKALIIFGTIVPGFLPSTDHRTIGLLTLSLIPVAVGLVVDSLWVIGASWARGWLTRSDNGLAAVKAIGAVLLFAMGVYLVADL